MSSAPTEFSSCTACGSVEVQAYGRKNAYALTRCSACRSVGLGEMPAPERVAQIYDQYYGASDFEAPPATLASLRGVVERFAGTRSSGRWLDVGFGEGALLEMAAESGWACHGVEVSPTAIDHGRDRGWVVTDRLDDHRRLPDCGFDVVTLVEVIEHLREPEAVLRAATDKLRQGGVLYMTTPNAAGMNARLLGAEWGVFCPPEHLTVFSPKGLEAMVRRCGCRVVGIDTHGLNPAQLLRSMRRRPGVPSAAERNSAGAALNQALSSGRSRRALKRVLNGALSALRWGDTIKLTARREATR